MRANREAQRRYSDWIPWGIAASYALAYSCLGVIRYRAYHASCDVGLFVQSISTAFHGFYNTTEAASHFAYHFSPILYLLAPLIWTWKSAVVLIIVQSVAGGLTIPPIYGIARRRLPVLPSILVAVIAGLYPALGGVSFIDFTENAFAPAAAAWLVWAIDSRRMVAATLFALICLCIKEDQAIIVAALGVTGAVYFYSRGERRWAVFSLGIVVLSVITITAFMTVVRPASGVWYGYPSIRDFYGGMNPLPLVLSLFSAPKIAYIVAMLVPLLGICLLSRCMLLAIPGLLECLLSRVPAAYTIGQHYAAVWVPYVLVAFAIGVSVLWQRQRKLVEPALLLSLGISLFINISASPNAWSTSLSARSHENDVLDDFISRLPHQASVTAFCPAYAHLGMYPNATVYAKSPTTFVIVYPQRDIAEWDGQEQQFVAASRGYSVLLDLNGLKIFERKAAMHPTAR
jgi:uncharacterized membrane protein